MRTSGAKSRFKRGDGGFITADFIFAIVMSFSIAMLFLGFAAALAMVEVAQYMTFAASRVYMGAHEEEAKQAELGSAKLKELLETKTFKALLSSGWFVIDAKGTKFADFSEQYPENDGSDNKIFVGARVPIDIKIFHLRIPFLGITTEDTNVGKATLNSYLMREPTSKECRDFNVQRYQKLRALNHNGTSPYQQAPDGKAKLITDNGC